MTLHTAPFLTLLAFVSIFLSVFLGSISLASTHAEGDSSTRSELNCDSIPVDALTALKLATNGTSPVDFQKQTLLRQRWMMAASFFITRYANRCRNFSELDSLLKAREINLGSTEQHHLRLLFQVRALQKKVPLPESVRQAIAFASMNHSPSPESIGSHSGNSTHKQESSDHRLFHAKGPPKGNVPRPKKRTEEMNSKLQLRSVRHAHYRGGQLPEVLEQDIIEMEEKLAKASEDDRTLLEKLYGENKDLLVYATRDLDGDGILDFGISEFYGKFFEFDTDVDGDGVLNTLDSHPFDKTRGGRDTSMPPDGTPDVEFTDVNTNGIPDHVDWALKKGKSSTMVKHQRELYDQHKIILVDRSLKFDEALADAAYDTLTRVYRNLFNNVTVLPTLRTIAADKYTMLSKKVDDGTFGVADSSNGSFTFYDSGKKLLPIIQLGLATHELGHNYQFSLDFAETAEFDPDNHTDDSPNFHELVRYYHWLTLWDESTVSPSPELFSPYWVSVGGVDRHYQYHDKTTEEWKKWLEALNEEVGKTYLDEERATQYKIVSDYSVTDPYEWYSENINAYLYTLMEDKAVELFADSYPNPRETVRKALFDTVDKEWGEFAYYQVKQSPFWEHLKEVHPVSDADVEFLVRKYLMAILPKPVK